MAKNGTRSHSPLERLDSAAESFLTAALFLDPQFCVAQEAQSTSFRAKTPWFTASEQAEIDRLFARPPNSPGYAVAIIRDGTFALAKGYGLANLDDEIPITPETSFHLASVSKAVYGGCDCAVDS